MSADLFSPGNLLMLLTQLPQCKEVALSSAHSVMVQMCLSQKGLHLAAIPLLDWVCSPSLHATDLALLVLENWKHKRKIQTISHGKRKYRHHKNRNEKRVAHTDEQRRIVQTFKSSTHRKMTRKLTQIRINSIERASKHIRTENKVHIYKRILDQFWPIKLRENKY